MSTTEVTTKGDEEVDKEIKTSSSQTTTTKKISMIKAEIPTKTDNMEIPQTKLLEEKRNTKLNTDL